MEDGFRRFATQLFPERDDFVYEPPSKSYDANASVCKYAKPKVWILNRRNCIAQSDHILRERFTTTRVKDEDERQSDAR